MSFSPANLDIWKPKHEAGGVSWPRGHPENRSAETQVAATA